MRSASRARTMSSASGFAEKLMESERFVAFDPLPSPSSLSLDVA